MLAPSARRVALAVVTFFAVVPLSRGYELLGRRWQPDQMPIKWCIVPGFDIEEIPANLEDDEVRAVFAIWQDDPGSDVTFEEVSCDARPLYGDTRPLLKVYFRGPRTAQFDMACMQYDPHSPSTRCGTVTWARSLDAYIKLGTDNRLVTHDQALAGDCSDEFDIRRRLAFLMGYQLGLYASSDPDATMGASSWNRCEPYLGLSGDDRAALGALYCPQVATFVVALASVDDGVDPGCTDGDGWADGGERVRIALDVANLADSDALGTTLRVASRSRWLHVTTPLVAVGDVARRGSTSASVEVEVDTRTPPRSDDALLVVVETPNGASQSFELAVPLQWDLSTEPESVVDDEMLPGAWMADGWTRITDPCAQGEASNPWRSTRGNDCTTEFRLGEVMTLDGRLTLPEDPRGQTVRLAYRFALALAGPNEQGVVSIRKTPTSTPHVVAYHRGTQAWQESGIYLPAWVDVGTSPIIRFEMRDSYSAPALGWSVDWVRLEWGDSSVVGQTEPTCERPGDVVASAGGDVSACPGQPMRVSAAASEGWHCGAVEYQWRRGSEILRPFSDDAELEYVTTEDDELELDVRCVESPWITDTDAVAIAVVPPPMPVGDTLRVTHDTEDDIGLAWIRPSDGNLVDVLRTPLDRLSDPMPIVLGSTPSVVYVDPSERGSFAYVVRSVNACGVAEP